jgi:hypothetical protein
MYKLITETVRGGQQKFEGGDRWEEQNQKPLTLALSRRERELIGECSGNAQN